MVPSKLIQYWNKFPLPTDIAELQHSWPSINPDINCELFDFDKAQEFIFTEYGCDISNLFESAALPAMQSDIFRLAYILAKGGIYIDMATHCKSSLTPLLQFPEKLILMRKWHGGIWNGLLIAQQQNPIVNIIWEKVLDNLKNRKFDDVWQATGPYNFNEVIKSNEDDTHYLIYPQNEITQYFELVNDLDHKKNNHWSEAQKNNNIYKD